MDTLSVSEPIAKTSSVPNIGDLPPKHDSKPRSARLFRLRAVSKHVISAVTVLLLLALWALTTHQGWIKPLFLPAPEAIGAAAGQAINGELDGEPLWVHLITSLLRIVGAFTLAVVLGVPLGLAMGMNQVARGIFDPLIEFYRPLPPLAYLPLMIIWFGIGETSKVLLIFLACFAPVVLAARSGVLSASQDQINAARSMGASRVQVLLYVVLPAALPEILVGLRIGMGVGWTTLVAAEMIAANAGIGQMVLNASNFLRTDVVMMGILLIGILAGIFEFGIRQLERVLVPWKGKV
jgi:taurine transport system permease protein